MSELEPGDPLWKLLGHAGRVEPSAFFVRQVAREVGGLAHRPTLWESFRKLLAPRPRIVWAGLGTACAAFALVFSYRAAAPSPADLAQSSPPSEIRSEAFDPASEMVAVEYLGQLMAVADPGQLDDDALADLFF